MNTISQKKRFPFAFKPNETLVQNLLISLDGQSEKILHHTTLFNENPEKAIHEIRKSFKRLRAVAVILKKNVPAEYRKWNTFWKDCSRKLASARESCVTVNTLAQFAGEIPELKTLCDEAVARRNAILAETEDDGTITDLANSISQSQNLIQTLIPETFQYPDLMEGVAVAYKKVHSQYKKTRKQVKSEKMHELRKRFKIVQYHTELMSELSPELNLFNSQISLGTELLGRYNDLNDLERFGDACRNRSSDATPDLLMKLIKKQKKSIGQEALSRISQLLKMDTRGYLDKYSVLTELNNS